MKYEDLKKVNDSIVTTDIKGKEYAEVNQRILAFRKLFPEGFIRTEILNLENGVCVIRAWCGFYEKDAEFSREHVLGSGIAYEKEGSTFINKTSYIENCETSAVGRALGMAGIGINTSVASAEEVQNAIVQQDSAKKLTKTQVDSLRLTIKNNPDKLGEDAILKRYKVTKLEDLTALNLREIIEYLNKEETK